MHEKEQMKSERIEKWWCDFEWCVLNTQKVRSSNKFKKMKSLCNRRVSVWNHATLKEIAVLYTNCIQFLPGPSLLFCTCYLDEIMIPCQLSTFSESFVVLFIFRVIQLKKSVNSWKVTNEVRKGWKLMMRLWMVHFEHRKTMEFKYVQKKWNPFVTDEFPYETLILRKRLSVLYTKCIQFLP